MTQNNVLTTTTELISSNHPMINLPRNLTTHSTKSYLDHQPMGILYHDEELAQSVLHQIKVCLNKVFTYTQFFNDLRQFTSYLAGKLIAKKIIFIICSKRAEFLYGVAEERPERCRIYILQLEHKLYVQSNLDSSPNVSKYLKEQFTQIENDIKTIDSSTDDQTLPPDDLADKITAESSSLSVFNSNSCEKSFRYLSSDSLKFLLFQSCIEVLIQIEHEAAAMDEMLQLCRVCYTNNAVELQKIDNFKINYIPSTAIHYYTQDSFVFRRVNEAFRLEDIERIFKFRLYVTDLYHQIVERAISRPNSQTGLELYRGKKLSNTTLQQLSDNKNKLISINGFLSTTRNIAIAKSFADIGQTREGYESVVFKLCIDEGAVVRSPFTDISEDSVIENELEILFTMGSVWLLERMEWNDGYWMIELRSCNDLDSQLNQLRNLTNGYTFLSMGNILRELGQYANAKNFYRRMLDIGPSDKTTCGLVYYHMGLLADEQGEYMDALDYFLKVEELIPAATRLSINSEAANSRPIYAYNHPPSKLHIWNNIARSYEKKGDFGNARLYYKKGLDEKNDPSDQAVVYYNLGSFEYHQGNYEEARRYFIEAHRLGSDYKIIQGSQQKLKMIDALFQRGVELLK